MASIGILSTAHRMTPHRVASILRLFYSHCFLAKYEGRKIVHDWLVHKRSKENKMSCIRRLADLTMKHPAKCRTEFTWLRHHIPRQYSEASSALTSDPPERIHGEAGDDEEVEVQ